MSDSKYASTDEGDVLLIFDPVPIDGDQQEDNATTPIPSHSDVEQSEQVIPETTQQPNNPPAEEADSVPCDWDIDCYRNRFETDEHWELRRKFMEQYKKTIAEEELVALAQALSNSVLLNTVYCEEISAKLNLLGAAIAEEYLNSRRQFAQKLTVPASTAIVDWMGRISEGQKRAQRKQLAVRMLKPTISISSLDDVFHNFVLLDDNLDDSGREFGMLNCGLFVFRLISHERRNWEGNITAAEFLLSKSVGQKKKVKQTCREEALQLLRKKCYKIKTNPNRCWDGCNVERLESVEPVDHQGNPFRKSSKLQTSKDQLKEDNIGFRMLRKLGWGGGPLGKHKEGIVDPIEVQAKRGRRGLGLPQLTPASSKTEPANYPNSFLVDGFQLENEAFHIDVSFYRDLMVNFKARQLGYDLIFSIDFTEIERALLCKIASDLNLQCMIATYDYEHYQFVLLKHRISPHDLLVRILVEKDPIYSALYTVEPPEEDMAKHKKILELCSR
ncbi:uncharacterized protein LOC134206737 [Armigeres subalbatus]|uniref:uncharacterized protein LOC134206737 n=1 Tax=Armigeres subalbatus TaxID=124917 RepID=UPI002ED20E08